MDLKNVNARALKWIKKNRERPFLLYLHYLDVHGPYVHPRAFSETVSRDIRETEINYYDGAIRYTDEQIGLFIERLRRLDALENSIVVITSDHGHEFYEHGRLGHGLSLYEEQLHIPLIFLNTRAFPFQGAFSQTVGLIDVLPTLVDHLDLKRQNNAVDGQSLMPLIARGETPEIPDYRYSETERYNLHRSVRYQNRWKYIISESIEPQQLFDLEHDPLERKNLVEEHPELANELKQKLDRKFAELQSRAAATTVVTADEKTVGLLKSLGYLN
jgi:arylsulfatase A-like enzyme